MYTSFDHLTSQSNLLQVFREHESAKVPVWEYDVTGWVRGYIPRAADATSGRKTCGLADQIAVNIVKRDLDELFQLAAHEGEDDNIICPQTICTLYNIKYDFLNCT